jgi:hypothetical protein
LYRTCDTAAESDASLCFAELRCCIDLTKWAELCCAVFWLCVASPGPQVRDEANVLEGLSSQPLFMAIVAGEAAMQVGSGATDVVQHRLTIPALAVMTVSLAHTATRFCTCVARMPRGMRCISLYRRRHSMVCTCLARMPREIRSLCRRWHVQPLQHAPQIPSAVRSKRMCTPARKTSMLDPKTTRTH